MAAPAGFNPSQSMLPDVKAEIVAFQGGGGQRGGAEDHDFLKQLLGPLLKALQEETDDGIEIDFTNKEGTRETFTSVSSATKDKKDIEAIQQKVKDLYEAIKTEKVEEALKLIADADDLTGKDEDGNTALVLACKTGKLEIVTALLEQGTAVDATSTEGSTPLMEASKLGHTKIMETLLVEWKANLNAQNEKGQTALWIATNANQLNAAELLLKKKAKMELLDTTQTSALMNAVQKSHADMVDILLKYDANPNVKNPKTGLTPFTQALTQLWLKDDADEEKKANRKRIATAFVSDTLGTFADTGKRYAKAIGDTITKAKRTFGPYFGFNRIDPTLRKTDVNVPMGSSTPLLLAIENKDVDMIMWILSRGAKLNAQGTPKKVPLFVALEKDDEGLVRVLLEKGANVNEVDEAGNTLLLIAIEKKNNKFIQLFVEKGSNLNKQGKKKEIPLFFAIENEDIPLIRYLLEKGAHVNEVDDKGDTPLLVAARKGNLDIVKKLLIYKADTKLKNKAGQTASAAATVPEIKTLLDDPAAITALKKAAGVTMVSGPRKEGKGKLVQDDPEEETEDTTNPLTKSIPAIGNGTEITTNPLTKKVPATGKGKQPATGNGTTGTSNPSAGKGKGLDSAASTGSTAGTDPEPDSDTDSAAGTGLDTGPGPGPGPTSNNIKVLAIGTTTRRGHDLFTDKNKDIVNKILKQPIRDNEYKRMPDETSLTLLPELETSTYTNKTYNMIWFSPDCQLEKIFTTNNYIQLIPKLYSLINPNGYVLFTESPYLIRLDSEGKQKPELKAIVADMDKKSHTGTIEQIDMLKKILKPKHQQTENIHPFPEYVHLNGKKEPFLIPFMKEWNQYFLLMKRDDFNVYQKRPQRILSINAVPSRKTLTTTLPNPLSAPVVGPTISNPLNPGVPTTPNPLAKDASKSLLNIYTKGSTYGPRTPITATRGRQRKGGSHSHSHSHSHSRRHKHRTQRKKRLHA